jgi:arginyl-tRNA synthetase
MWMKQIQQDILGALQALQLPTCEFSLEHPEIESFGDYSSNVAMVLFPQLKKANDQNYPNPRILAEAIISAINNDSSKQSDYQSVTVAGPGFINFTLPSTSYTPILEEIIKSGATFGKHHLYQNKKVVIEYTDPNPFKEFHIGHLYSNIVGETIARLYENAGATVWRADYFGDVGMHVAKSIWGLLTKFKTENKTLNDIAITSLPDRIHYLGQAYALGAAAYEDNPEATDQIKNLNAALYQVAQHFVETTFHQSPIVQYPQPQNSSFFKDVDLYTIYTTCRTWSLDYFDSIYERLGTKFDGYYPESAVGETGYTLVTNHPEFFIKGEGGAIIFPGKKYGLHDRVFINSLKLPTYECKELGLVSTKYKDFPYDKSVIITANEINDYFNVLLKAMELVEPELGPKTMHIGHGMVKLPEGKMSSRTGNITTGESLLNAAESASLEIINSLNPDLANKDITSKQVGLAAVRYALLRANIGKDVIYDFKESVSFNGNSGPYLQYTIARCTSLAEKAAVQTNQNVNEAYTFNETELSIIKWLARYPEITEKAVIEHAPHIICEYCYDLAQRFNAYYHHNPIIGNSFRLKLTAATKTVLENALTILGIPSPHHM